MSSAVTRASISSAANSNSHHAGIINNNPSNTSPVPVQPGPLPAGKQQQQHQQQTKPNAHTQGADFKRKQRKREVVVKNDPEAFRDALLALIEPDCSIDTYGAILESSAEKLDYKRYAETFFEFVIAGGIVAPGGGIVDDGARPNPFSVFACEDTVALVRHRVDLIIKVIRRYKYLERHLQETIAHLLQYANKFTPENTHKLATATGFFISYNNLPLAVVSTLLKEHLVKDGSSLAFLTTVLQTYLLDQPVDALTTLLARVQLVDDKLLEFFPQNKRSDDAVAKHFDAAGLKSVVEYIKKRKGDVVKARVAEEIKELVSGGKATAQVDVTVLAKREMKENGWTEAETVTVLWETLVGSVEWSSKPDAFEIQLLKVLNTYPKLLESFCTSPKSEITLLQRVQMTCYTDARFLKHFRTIVTLFYKNDIVSEAAVLFWAEKGGALTQGKTVFVKQVEPFVEWLKAQEDESEDEDE
ncbi:Basic leucine zipper and W2 domain-containing protein 1 [Physocladia obscura]|uniref:Basic leucine zipper and W2 domain-containing protein 1 n=1 Tax=Physocladia obscura TaxID=109957 RepID=A0AAD5SZS0_9FUNG|nr:Basic leucine zipper and W2 domain-containing protein 1 [Physocladia obscura]